MNPISIILNLDTYTQIRKLADDMNLSFTEAARICLFVGLRRETIKSNLSPETRSVSIRLSAEVREDLIRVKPQGRALVSFIRDVLEVSLLEQIEPAE